MLLQALTIAVLFCGIKVSHSQIGGCPMWGCKPSGSFSVQLEAFPLDPEIQWQLVTSYRSKGDVLGCVANDKNIVCPTVTGSSSGYISLFNGTVQWIDRVLKNPTLPLMNIYGDIIGSDGLHLVNYLVNGTLQKPKIRINPPMKPIYSLTITDTDIFFIPSETGELVTYFTNGIVLASIHINETIDGVNGTFVPISQPVIGGHRSFFMTKFLPHEHSTIALPRMRLYAVDFVHVMAQRMRVVWYYETPYHAMAKPILVVYNDTVHVSLDDQFYSFTVNGTLLYTVSLMSGMQSLAINDNDIVSSIPPFKRNMASSIPPFKRNMAAKSVLWIATTNPGEILCMDERSGFIIHKFNMQDIIGGPVNITSKLLITSTANLTETRMVLAVQVLDNPGGLEGNKVVGLDISTVTSPQLIWQKFIPDPLFKSKGCHVKGQLASFFTSGTNNNYVNFVGYCETEDFGSVFALGYVV